MCRASNIVRDAMSDMPDTREQFLVALQVLVDGQHKPQDQTQQLRQALLDFGSETPDNLNCAKRIEIGAVAQETGLKVSGQSVLLADLAHTLESEPMPPGIASQFPQITEQDWDAFTRMTTLLYALLSPHGSSHG